MSRSWRLGWGTQQVKQLEIGEGIEQVGVLEVGWGNGTGKGIVVRVSNTSDIARVSQLNTLIIPLLL